MVTVGLIDGLRSTYHKIKDIAIPKDILPEDVDYDYYDDGDEDVRVFPEPTKSVRDLRTSRGARPPLGPINPGKDKGGAKAAGRGDSRAVAGVVQMPGTAPRGNNIVIVHPADIDECDEICMEIREGAAVALNLDGVEHGSAQRIVDFCAGVVAALDGEIREAADKVFIIAPRNFMITGQSREILRKAGIVLPYEER